MPRRTSLTLISALIVGAVLIPVLSSGGNVSDLGASIPRTILGWRAIGDDRVYDTRTIYDYLDGGAEVYLAFDLKRVFARKYQGLSEVWIALDIYEMGSPEEAFGVFSCDREDPTAGIGQESEYGPGLLRFWQGRFFVSATASGDEQAAKEPILALGRAVAPLLGPDGARPALLELLPLQGLIKDRTSYFHDAINLNNRFFISAENILNLDKKTECALGEYAAEAGSGETVKLLLVRYSTEALARTASYGSLRFTTPLAQGPNAPQAEKGRWNTGRLHGRILALVFNAPSREYAESLLAAVRYPNE
jgi:hypothetical protein